MRVLVCGSRTWTTRWLIESMLVKHKATVVIDGAAKGADSLGHNVAVGLGLKTIRFPADWKKHGKAAGPIRNQQMLDEGKPDLVLAFWDGKSRGTQDMIERTKKAGIEITVFKPYMEIVND